ncbi:MAG: MFS transporter [Deinococcota bacterium]
MKDFEHVEVSSRAPNPTVPNPTWRSFLTVWVGQYISTLGSSLTSFVAAWWVFEQTGSATQFALTMVFTVLPFILFSPFAGIVVDRYSRRRVMILADIVAAGSSAFLLILLLLAQLDVWHIYLASVINSVAHVFQGPAYKASISLLVPKARLARANGLVQFSVASGRITAPLLAGFLISTLGLAGVIGLDLLTFAISLATLLVVRFPRLRNQGLKNQGLKNQATSTNKMVWRDLLVGWQYLIHHRGLLGLALLNMLYNFLNNFGLILKTPLLLSLGSPKMLGVVLSIGGSGMVLGSIFMATWGPARHLIKVNLGFLLMSGVGIVIVGLRPSPLLIALGLFVFYFSFAASGAAGSTLFQRKVAHEVQGQVFATKQLLSFLAEPFAYLMVGPLVEFVFGPRLVVGGAWDSSVGRIVGVGPTRGMGFLTVLAGVLIVITTAAVYLIPSVGQFEKELPDEI